MGSKKISNYVMEEVKYAPSEIDLRHMQEIRDFLNEEKIPFEESTEIFGLIYANDKTLELRYVDSYFFPIDNSKRFGDKCKGVDKNYFINISHEKHNKGIRVIWIYDFEMEQTSPDFVFMGEAKRGYHRQWEVIKNTIRTACGRIHYRFFARDCEVREVPNYEMRPFLEHNCFYGYRSCNVCLGLYLKKDKNGLKAGTLLMIYSFGANFYGNKLHKENPKIEVIRASTLIGCQVIGGISKFIKHFCENYPTLTVAGKEVEVDRIVFYVDAAHNDSRGMTNSNSSFKFVSWEGAGFMNRFVNDVDEDGLKGCRGEIFMRRPMFHRVIMKNIGEGNIVSIGTPGTIVFEMSRKEFLENNT
jgi:hypothetical protein